MCRERPGCLGFLFRPGDLLRRNPSRGRSENNCRENSSDIAPEDVEALLAPGFIESLVRQGRTPLQIGLIGSPGEEMSPYYQVPPQGYNPKLLEKVERITGGAFAFFYKDGTIKTSPTFTLMEAQAAEVEARIAAEKEHLAQSAHSPQFFAP